MAKITYTDKSVGDEFTADDANEIKNVVNENADNAPSLENVKQIGFDITLDNPAHQEGLLFYDKGKKALSYYNDEEDTTLNIGQELVIKVYNNNGGTITNGEAVRLDGTAVDGVPTVIRSLADTIENASVGGLATHDILVGETGYITVWGTLGGIDTSSFSEGDFLFLSATVPGGLTNVEQQILKPIGQVLVEAVDGTILVGQRGIVNITAVGQVGKEDGSSQLFTTTPQPLGLYNNTLLEQNVTVIQTGAAPTNAQLQPTSIGASGLYEISFSIAGVGSANSIHTFSVYVNGSPSGVGGVVDLSNNNIDAGGTSFSAVSTAVLTPTDIVEIYGSVDSGTSTFDVASLIFNMKRIGNV